MSTTPTPDDSLGTQDGLATWLGRTFDTPQAQAQADQALIMAQGTLRALCRQYLSAAADDALVLDWDGGVSVFLPELPVVAVDAVEGHDPNAADPTAWVAWPATWWWSQRTGEVRLSSPDYSGWWWGASGWWWGSCGSELQALRITYDHGFDPVPAELLGVVYGLAGRGLGGAATGGVPVKAETIGGYSYQLGDVSAASGSWAAGLTSAEAAIVSRYRMPVTAQ